MYAVDIPSAVAVKPGYPAGGSAGWFTDCDPTSDATGTVLAAAWLNRVQAELLALVTGLGGAPDPANDHQIVDLLMAYLAAHATPPVAAYTHGISLKVTGDAAIVANLDYGILANAAGARTAASAVAATLNLGAVGLNGLDAGALAANTWYAVYAVANGSGGFGFVCSTSFTQPGATFRTTYPYYLRIGAVRANVSAKLLGTLQIGRKVHYILGGQNLTALPLMASGVQATPAAVAVAAFVPPSAASIGCQVTNAGNAPGNISLSGAVAANASYTGIVATTGATPALIGVGGASATSGYVPGTSSGFLLLESANVYWQSTAPSGGTAYLYCFGWEDTV